MAQPPQGTPTLQILDIRPSPPGSTTLARFDLQLNDHLRLYNLGLRQRGNEPAHVTAPNAFQQRVAGFSASFSKALAELALKSLVELQTANACAS
jgi:hypothetical protein